MLLLVNSKKSYSPSELKKDSCCKNSNFFLQDSPPRRCCISIKDFFLSLSMIDNFLVIWNPPDSPFFILNILQSLLAVKRTPFLSFKSNTFPELTSLLDQNCGSYQRRSPQRSMQLSHYVMRLNPQRRMKGCRVWRRRTRYSEPQVELRWWKYQSWRSRSSDLPTDASDKVLREDEESRSFSSSNIKLFIQKDLKATARSSKDIVLSLPPNIHHNPYKQATTFTPSHIIVYKSANVICIAIQNNHSKLENIIKKTNLGIAVQQAISELGLQRQRSKIMTYLQKSFEEKYEEFKKTVSTNTGTLRGYYVTDNEFPIGEHDKQQYFRSVAFQAKINSTSLTTSSGGEKKPFTLIQGYSRNDESKKRNYSKAHSKSEKKVGETSGKKKPKK